MSIMIRLNDHLEAQLQQRADAEHRSVEAVALDILHAAVAPEHSEERSSVESIVAKIRAATPDPQRIRPAQGSLADALHRAPAHNDFDLQQWNRDWAAVEAEMHAMNRSEYQTEERE